MDFNRIHRCNKRREMKINRLQRSLLLQEVQVASYIEAY